MFPVSVVPIGEERVEAFPGAHATQGSEGITAESMTEDVPTNSGTGIATTRELPPPMLQQKHYLKRKRIPPDRNKPIFY